MNVKNEQKPIEPLRMILREQNGILFTSDLAKLGIPRTYLSILEAKAQKRISFDKLKNSNAIVRTIQADSNMRARWDRHCREYFFSHGISFDEVIEVLYDVLQGERT